MLETRFGADSENLDGYGVLSHDPVRTVSASTTFTFSTTTTTST
jgi:hypothetical protein